DVVEAALEHLEEVYARDPLRPGGVREVVPELPLEHAVHPLDLLLLPELDAVALDLGPAASVLAGGVAASFERAFLLEAAVALEEQLHPLATAQPADRFGMSGHGISLVSDAAPLRRAAPVVRDRRDVLDRFDVHPRGLKRADRRLPPGARPLDADVE